MIAAGCVECGETWHAFYGRAVDPRLAEFNATHPDMNRPPTRDELEALSSIYPCGLSTQGEGPCCATMHLGVARSNEIENYAFPDIPRAGKNEISPMGGLRSTARQTAGWTFAPRGTHSNPASRA